MDTEKAIELIHMLNDMDVHARQRHDEKQMELGRIGDALERIADSLESKE